MRVSPCWCTGTDFSSATSEESDRRAKREEAAKARLLDARRILSICERRQGLFQGRVERVMRFFVSTPNERRTIASGKSVARSRLKAFCEQNDGFPARDGAALNCRRGKGALHSLDTALKRPLTTFLNTERAPNVDQTRLRRLLARRCGETEIVLSLF